MADDDDIDVLNEEENQLDNMLRSNGYDPSEFDLTEKRQMAADLVGDTSPQVTAGIDANSDQLRGSVPADERDESDRV